MASLSGWIETRNANRPPANPWPNLPDRLFCNLYRKMAEYSFLLPTIQRENPKRRNFHMDLFDIVTPLLWISLFISILAAVWGVRKRSIFILVIWALISGIISLLAMFSTGMLLLTIPLAPLIIAGWVGFKKWCLH